MAGLKVSTRNKAADEINIPSFSSNLWRCHFYMIILSLGN